MAAQTAALAHWRAIAPSSNPPRSGRVQRPAARLAGSSRRAPPCRASGSGGDSGGAGAGPALTLGEAFATLGLAEGTPYEDVLAAKNRLLEKSSDDFERRMEIEAAYDLIFSSQLRARLTGDLPVSTNVRFADVRRQRPAGGGGGAAGGAAAAAQKAGQLLQGLPSGGLTVTPPAPRTAATAAGVYGALAAWTLAQGLLEPTPAAAAADVPGAQLALATAATVYLLRDQKRVGLGKAAALALGGLVLGTFVGAGVQSWLRVDVIPLGGLASPGALVGEFSIAALAAVCLFLA